MDTLCMFNADIKPNSNLTVIQLLKVSIVMLYQNH